MKTEPHLKWPLLYTCSRWFVISGIRWDHVKNQMHWCRLEVENNPKGNLMITFALYVFLYVCDKKIHRPKCFRRRVFFCSGEHCFHSHVRNVIVGCVLIGRLNKISLKATKIKLVYWIYKEIFVYRIYCNLWSEEYKKF